MSNILYSLYSKIPNLPIIGTINNKIWCYNCNIKNKDIKMSYTNGYFNIALKDFNFKCYDNFFYEWHCVKGYLRSYSPKSGDTVLDIGAGFGDFSLYASKLVGNTGLIIAFEPDPKNFERLRKNIELNNLTNVRAVKKLVLDSDREKIPFNCLGKDCSSIKLSLDNNDKVEFIPAVSLDKEIERMNIKKINFIKMDVESAEVDILKGCAKLMKNNPINFAIASYHPWNNKESYHELEKIFKARGYEYKTEYPVHLTTYAWPK